MKPRKRTFHQTVRAIVDKGRHPLIPTWERLVQRGRMTAVFSRNEQGKEVAVSMFYPKPFTPREVAKHIGEEHWDELRQDANFLRDLNKVGLRINDLKIGIGHYIETTKNEKGHGHGSSVVRQGEAIMKANGAQVRIIIFTGSGDDTLYVKNGYKMFQHRPTWRPRLLPRGSGDKQKSYRIPRLCYYKIL